MKFEAAMHTWFPGGSRCKDIHKRPCSSLSYDAVTAHSAMVCVQYMILAEHQRFYTERSIGDLFYAAIEELSDLAYEEAFILITAVVHAVSKSFELSEHECKRMVDTFIATMPPALSKRLKFSA